MKVEIRHIYVKQMWAKLDLIVYWHLRSCKLNPGVSWVERSKFFNSRPCVIFNLNLSKQPIDLVIIGTILYLGMKSHQLLSDKDLQVLKVTYRTVIENYYENPSEQNAGGILLLNALTMQTISTREQSDALLLVSMLQILKVKTKSNKQLCESIQNTIIHLKNPLKIYLKDQTIQESLERMELYTLSCTIINQFYDLEMKPRADTYNWKEIITKISKNSDKNMTMALSTIVHLLPDFPNYSKQVSKSGMIKYLCSIYLPQVLQDRISLYRSLKVLKMVACNDRSVLPGREKNVALVIFHYPAYILIVQQIEEACYDQEYTQKVIDNVKDIDPIYVWSYNPNFCLACSQRTVDQLENLLKMGGKGIPAELEWKIYIAINNIVKAQNAKIAECWRIPINGEKNLNAYLKLVISMIEKNGEYYKNIDIKAIQYAYDRFKVTDPITDKLIKDLKNLEPSISNKKIGRLESSIFQHYSVDKNPEMLMEKAAKIPKNNEDLRVTQQILGLNNKNADQIQRDIIKTLKNKSIESVRTSVCQKYPIEIAKLFNNINLDANDPETVNKIVRLGQLSLTIDLDSAEKYDKKKFLAIVEWLENNCGLAIIDWIAVSQMLAIIFGVDQWKNHLSEIPKKCFWLLNASSGELSPEIMLKINSVPLNHGKIALIIGFISKGGDAQLRKLMLKSPLVEQTISDICGYKSSRASTKTYKPEQDASDGEIMKKYLINALNMSYYISNWSTSDMAKEVEAKVIRPCLQNILRCFIGYEHEYRFVENSLPFKFNIAELKEVNVGKLLETHGKLASYLYQNKYDGRIDFGKISTISSETDPAKIQQILRFLLDNPDMIQCSDLVSLLDYLVKHSKKEPKYWKLYPNYMSILEYILDIATKSTNPEVIDKLAEIFEKAITGTAENQDITDDELSELYEKIYQGIERLIQRKIKIDAKRLKREAEKIKDDQWKRKIMDKLKVMNQMSIAVEPSKVSITPEVQEVKPNYIPNSYQSTANLAVNKMPDTRIQASNLGGNSVGDISKLGATNLKIAPVEFEEKKDENIFQGSIDTNEFIQTEEINLPNQSPEQRRLIEALKLLKKIVQKQEPKQTFPKLVQIFHASEFNKNRRYILGHLLTEYYETIQKDKHVIELLQMKDKTNLCKQVCYKFLLQFEEVFAVGKRWKLIGPEFVDLAISRLKCTNQNKAMCVENGCEIAEYNLMKSADISYFETKKYHQVVVNLVGKLEHQNQALYYFLLIGTSARLTEIKAFYIANKVHSILLDYVNKPDWLKDKRISANLSYALSSLVYTQNHIAIEVASKKQEMIKLMGSYREFSTTKSVVEAGCSLLSNICYSNKETKELLYNYGVNALLIELVSKNLEKPQVSTYKQIMRTLGNISLHKLSTEWLINEHVCKFIVAMAQKFNILIFRDDQKLKVLKLTVDFFSNLASHKFSLETIHAEGVTNFVITILETTEISEDQILMACIDTIDGLCQNQQIENYVVMDKKLLLQLIDLLKIKEDEKLITKSIRLLTNMTLNDVCIPYILQANLLSVLANIVLSVYRNEKINTYINKIIIRIFSRKPDIKPILKSGYLDCLMKAIQINDQIDDQYIDILLFYCQYIPNYLNHRAFFNLVKVLTTKQNQKEIVDKCFKVIRVIFSSEEREDDDIVIEGSSSMYQKLLQNNQANKLDIIYLIGIHCTKSRKFKKQLLLDHLKKKGNTLDYIHKMMQDEESRELASSVLFTILNKDRALVDVGQEIVQQEDFAYRLLTKGFQCKLFRMDGSSKNAIVDINEMYMIRAYKYPDGEIKKKYVISIRQLRDWQFQFEPNDDVWKNSVFNKEKSVFEAKPKIENCVTLLGSQQWGQFSLINLQFGDTLSKVQFVKAISALVLSFKV